MRLNALKKLRAHKKLIVLIALIVVVSFFFVNPVYAMPKWIGEVVGGIIFVFIWSLGQIVLLVMRVLLAIIQYQGFITAPAVIQGWMIVRDIANMFFVVVLLVISFATILHIEEYNYKKWLPKLILMAVLINFSKTICGVLIDVTQLVMLTFVNSFRSIAGGSFVDMLGITEVLTFASSDDSVGGGAIIGAYVLGFVYMAIALVVITTMTLILAMRLVMIWIYVVLSPLAYLLSAFPGGAKYASKWWTDFISNLIVGPVLAFFIWLSFAALQTTSDPNQFDFNDEKNYAATANEQNFVKDTDGGIDDSSNMTTKGSKPSVLIKFIIGIGMLIGGMKIAQEVGGAAGSIAGKGMGKINAMAAGVTGAVGGYALSKAKFAGRTALGVGAGAAKLGGMGLGAVSKGKLGQGLQAMGDTGLNLRRDLISDKNKAKVEGRKKFLRKIGASAETADKFSDSFGGNNRNNQATVNGTALMTMGAFGGSAFGPLGTVLGTIIGGTIATGLRGVGVLRNRQVTQAERDLNGKEGDLSTAQAEYNRVFAASGNNATDPAVQAEQAKVDAAFKAVEASKQNLQAKKGKGDSFEASLLSAADSLVAFSTGLTVEAAKSLAEDKKYGRQQVGAMANNANYLRGANDSALGSTSGQTARQSEVINNLVDPNNKEAPLAIANLMAEIQAYRPGTGDTAMEQKLRLFSQNIAATDKKGEVSLAPLAGVMALLDSKAAQVGDSTKLDTVANYRNSAIPYRESGITGQQGTGELYVDSMAAGKENHQMAGVDFNKLKEKGFDINATADGAFIKGDDMAKFGTALSQVIADARAQLDADYANKDNGMSLDEYDKKLNTLNQADQKLKDGSFKDSGMMLVNSGGANFGRNAKLTTAYHEAVHKGGIDDEEIAEGLAVALMNGKLYGRNPETKGSHVTEITALAKAMKEGGSSNDEVLKAMSAEIAKRSQSELSNRAARVVAQTGGAPTQAQSMGVPQEVVASLDTSRLEAAIESAFSGTKKSQLFNPGPQLDAIRRVTQAGTAAQLKALSKVGNAMSKGANPLVVEVGVRAMASEADKVKK